MGPDSTSEQKITIEPHKRFSQSALWRMQREYFDKEGINAWVSQVPFYITSNPYIADSYAQIVLAFMQDWIKQHPDANKHPFYIMELGTGSGRFSYYVVKSLLESLKLRGLDDIKFCYIMSDFTMHNIEYWQTHPVLKPYVEAGLIDFAVYDMEVDQPLTLIRQNITLSPEILVNPLTAFANYIFDTISHDSFTVQEGKLYELLIGLSTHEHNMQDGHPIDMEKISVDYSLQEIHDAYYGDPHLDTILDEYKQKLHSTSFLFPIGSFKAIKFLEKLSNNRLLIISTDKGYTKLESLDKLGHPSVTFHKSFSMMVNFHAIGQYFNASGGEAFLHTPRKGIRTAVFSSGFKLSDLGQTCAAIEDKVERLSPSDYFTLHRHISDHIDSYDLSAIAAYMEFALWDPHIYLKLTDRIISLVPGADSETLAFMAKNMPRLAANYYCMPQTKCVLADIGMFFHAIKRFDEALKYYQQALLYTGEQFGLVYNIALCQHQLGDNKAALLSFQRAVQLDSSASYAAEWVAYVEKILADAEPLN